MDQARQPGLNPHLIGHSPTKLPPLLCRILSQDLSESLAASASSRKADLKQWSQRRFHLFGAWDTSLTTEKNSKTLTQLRSDFQFFFAEFQDGRRSFVCYAPSFETHPCAFQLILISSRPPDLTSHCKEDQAGCQIILPITCYRVGVCYVYLDRLWICTPLQIVQRGFAPTFEWIRRDIVWTQGSYGPGRSKSMPILRGAGADIETRLKTLWFMCHLKPSVGKKTNFGYQISTASHR